MHPLLEMQLRQLPDESADPARLPAHWRDFVAAIDATYREMDEDRALRERSMEAMLGELKERNRLLEDEKTEQAQLIEKLRQAQQQLLQSEKLASIGQLAAGVAHEINNPIGFVQSNLRTLERYFADLSRILEHLAASRDDDAWVEELRAIVRAADCEFLSEDIPALLAESLDGVERVRKIVLDLRNFSRVDVEQVRERADLRTILDSTLNIVHNEIKYRAEVVKEYDAVPPVECVPSQLGQVFMNLLVNAAQAMPDGRLGHIAIRCGQTGNAAWVEIADDGVGIPEENLQKIFDPFFTTKPVGKGTGLGLALSYGIVEKHAGRIEVNSKPGEGTTFRIVLPVAPETPA